MRSERMTVRQQWMFVGVVVLILGGGLLAATRFLGDELFPVTIGSKAPAFHANTIDGAPTTKTLESYKGEVVLLNVWGTWCIPCRTEMPSIQALHDRFAARGLKVVAVSVDKAGFENEIRKFRDQYGLTFEILHDPSGDIQRDYQTTGVPETFIIGRDGMIRRKVIAADNWDSPANRALFAQMLGVPASAAGVGSDAPGAAAVPVRP
ncbi:MAG TPA: TlpA disulfide reductase family protein [Gemmatimonadaceae bacterium]|nr:TlpA disulfide reductase family protein [Gemmatimonadaceae bacterium]